LKLTEQTISGFTDRFGYEPSGVWSAPGRANLIGEHTDYNNGFVLPFGIDRRTYVALGERQDKQIRVSSSFGDQVVEINLVKAKPTDLDWALYPLGVAWVMREHQVTGLDIFIHSDVPIGAGLSSSAAVECSVALALNDLWQAGKSRIELALIGQRAENEVVGAPTGIMDQTASLLARADGAVFIDCQTLETKNVSLGLAELGLVVAVIDTQVSHRHSDGGYRSRREACERGAELMDVESLRELSVADLERAQGLMDDLTFRRVRHVVTENARVLETLDALADGQLQKLGELLLSSHASMRDDFEISIPELDLAVETAMATGAIGSRMTGGGFGGAAIAIIAETKLSELERNVIAAFAGAGFAEPRVFAVLPSQGARREA
jgi:galactokinase